MDVWSVPYGLIYHVVQSFYWWMWKSSPHLRRMCIGLCLWWQTTASSIAFYCPLTSAGTRSWRSCLCWLTPETWKKKSTMSFSVIVHSYTPTAAVTSLRAAGIFFCLLEKAKVALPPGDTADVKALLSEHKHAAVLIHLKIWEVICARLQTITDGSQTYFSAAEGWWNTGHRHELTGSLDIQGRVC